MILKALVDYYDRLAAEPDSDIAPFGFSRQKISFAIVLQPDGTLVAIHDARVDVDGRMVPRLLVVPGQAYPPGGKIEPRLLWGNATYLLGVVPDGREQPWAFERFDKFCATQLGAEAEIDDQPFSAVCKFLRAWRPTDAAKRSDLAETTSSFGVFRLQGTQEYVHSRPKVRDYWLRRLTVENDAPLAPSLVSGEMQPIARLHQPRMKIRGGQSAGAPLVSFNADAYESYGKSQSFNAPVGIGDAFKYCTALDRLTSKRDRQVHLGDTTVVFWSEKPTAFEDQLLGVFESTEAEDPAVVARLTGFFERLRRATEGVPFEGADVPFYVLGLSPNAARVSVRFWEVGTVQQFAERLGRHLSDLELSGKPPTMLPITLQRMIDQTARERDDIQPLLGGAVLRAVLTGGPYPLSLSAAVLRRIRADGQTDGANGHIRAAIIKAYLVRQARFSNKKETVSMALDKNCPHPAYNLGRLFAALEKTQEDALGGDLNVTIKDRYFSSASANPVAAFPRLLRLHAHHLDKLGSEKRGLKIAREKLVQEICGRVDAASGFPAQLSLDEQGLFFIGYYHQRQDFFTSKKSAGETNDNAMSAAGAREE